MPERKSSEWPSMDARRRSFTELQWLALPFHRQLGIVPEIREVATTDYRGGWHAVMRHGDEYEGEFSNNHLYRAKVSVARAA